MIASIGSAATAPLPYFKTLDSGLRQKLETRLKEVNADIVNRGLHEIPGYEGKMITGYAYNEFYDWDIYFENLYLSYYGVNDYCFTNFRMFLDRQHPDGFIMRTLRLNKPRHLFKPFLAQIAVLGSKQNGRGYEWLREKYYGQLCKFIERWQACDGDGNGLPVWADADHSGMDNQFSRAGNMNSFTVEGVDLACYLLQELRAMACIAENLGIEADRQKFLKEADSLVHAINENLWDEQEGFYFDRNEKTGKRVPVKSVGAFLPLWAGVPSPEQARRLVREHLLNENEFWLPYPVASYAKTEPEFFQGERADRKFCNWMGPAWVPTNYLIFHGLRKYGFDAEAKELAGRTFRMALELNKVTREYYDSDTGHGNGMNPFWGWSALAYVMPLEFQESYNPMELKSKIRPFLSEAIGPFLRSPQRSSP